MRIQWGDTLSAIAARFKTTVSALARANGIANPNRIYAGDELKIPGVSGGDTFEPGSQRRRAAARAGSAARTRSARRPAR